MIYKASSDLMRQISKIERRDIGYIFFRIASVFVCYFVIFNDYDLVTIMMDAGVAGLLGLVTYSQLKSQKSVLNATAIEINIEESYIKVITAPFKVLFIVNKSSAVLQFNKEMVKIRNAEYPLIKSFDLVESNTIKLSQDQNDVYILTEFFEKEIAEKLKSF